LKKQWSCGLKMKVFKFLFFYFFLIHLAVAKIYGSKLNDLQIGNKIVTA